MLDLDKTQVSVCIMYYLKLMIVYFINLLIAQCGDQPSPGKEEATADDEEWEDEDLPYFKMTFIVNTSLKMGVGKIAAQVGHACLGLYRDMLKNNMEDDLSQWEEIG